ncbi:hypothetical protein [Rheinheimera sp. NSM]|uniref:hypothetical protein n=1 Tax=Rheinheimera sp. NSM TaxID=3457884 RepID=UPI0040366236
MLRYFILLAALYPMSASAYDGWSGVHKVQSVRVYSENHVLVTMPQTSNPGGCESTQYLVLNNADSEAGKRLYSALLSAYAADKSVNLALTGCSSGEKLGWPVIEQVWLK